MVQTSWLSLKTFKHEICIWPKWLNIRPDSKWSECCWFWLPVGFDLVLTVQDWGSHLCPCIAAQYQGSSACLFADPADTCLFFSSVQSKRWAPEESKLHINVSDNTEVQLEILQTGTATGPTNSSTFIIASLDNLLSGVSGYRYSKFPLQLSDSMCPLYLNDLVSRTFAWKGGWLLHAPGMVNLRNTQRH